MTPTSVIGCLSCTALIGILLLSLPKVQGLEPTPQSTETADHNEDLVYLNFTEAQIQSALERGREDNSSMSDISVVFYYTLPFKNIVTDPVLYIEHLIEGASQVFQNNELPIRITQLCVEQLDVEESPSSDSRLNEFLYAKSNLTAVEKGDEDIMSAAESILSTADIAILMTATAVERSHSMRGTMTSTGGTAFRGPSPIEGHPPLAWLTAGDKHGDDDPVQLFTHEVGHILGGYHNREEHDGGLSNKTHYGYLVEGTNYRTIMAYDTEHQNNVWIPFFSSKDITYDGFQIGDAQNDNRKTLLENRFLISQIGDESGNCPNTVTSCAGNCLRGNLVPDNHTLDEREIWCRNHCNMTSTGYYNLLGKPVGLSNSNGKLARTIIFYVILSVMFLLTGVYITQLVNGNSCSPERKQYRKMKVSLSAPANMLAVLGLFLNGGFMVLNLIFYGGLRDYVGISVWLMAGVVDGMFLCAVRVKESNRGLVLKVWAAGKVATAAYQAGWFFLMAYVMADSWPARYDLAVYFIMGGGIAMATAAAFLRVVWRDCNVRRAKEEDESDE